MWDWRGFEVALGSCPALRCAVGSAMALPCARGAFDVVVSLDVLYHRSIPDKLAPLREMRAVLKEGGLLF